MSAPERLFRFVGDGWYPHIDDAAETVCYGNVASGAWHIGGGLWPSIPGRNSRFIRPGVVTFTRELDALHFERWERQLATGATVKTGDDPFLVAGNDFDAGAGRWASCIAAGRLVIDGVVQPGGPYRFVQVSGGFTVSVEADARYVLFLNGQRISTTPLPPRANAFRIVRDGAAVTTGFFWDSTLLELAGALAGTAHDITLSPWRRENPPVLVTSDDGTWAWTFTHAGDGGKFGLIGRRLRDGGDKIIAIPGVDGSTWVDAAYDARRQRFLVAASSEKGVLEVWSVPIDAPPTDLNTWRPAAPPPPRPDPPNPDPRPDPPQETQTMTLPDAVKATIRAFADRFPLPRSNRDDNERRAWTMNLISHLAFKHGAKWGGKSGDPGRPISKDSIAFNGDVLFGFDIVDGATMTLKFPVGLDLTNKTPENEFTAPQTFWPAGETDRSGNTIPAPRDWLGGTTPVPEPDPGEPDPGEPHQPPPVGGDEYLAAINANTLALVALREAFTDALGGINTRLDTIERDGVKVRFK